MKFNACMTKLLTTKLSVLLMLVLVAGGEAENTPHCGSVSGGAVVLEDGAAMVVGQPVAGVSSNANYTAHFGTVFCLAFQSAGPQCEGDADGNDTVDVLDLLEVLGSWGPCAGCPADLNGDNVVDIVDLLLVLGSWGPCV